MADVNVFQTWQMLLGRVPTPSQHSAFPMAARFQRVRDCSPSATSRRGRRTATPDAGDAYGDRTRSRSVVGQDVESRVQAGWRLVRSVEDQEAMEYPEGETTAGWSRCRNAWTPRR